MEFKMPEIFKFPIPEAYAERNANGGITVTLVYPDEEKRAYSNERKLSNADAVAFGIRELQSLQRGEQAAIGTPLYLSRPASGGIIDMFSDGSFLTHRRDGGTITYECPAKVSCGPLKAWEGEKEILHQDGTKECVFSVGAPS